MNILLLVLLASLIVALFVACVLFLQRRFVQSFNSPCVSYFGTCFHRRHSLCLYDWLQAKHHGATDLDSSRERGCRDVLPSVDR